MISFWYFIVLLFKMVSGEKSCECNSELDPICASDGKVYKNQCEFNCINLASNETLKEKPRFFCVERCMVPLIYSPVCGTNGKTYVNKYSAECDQWAYPEIGLEFVPANKLPGDSFLPEYEECRYDCQCPRRWKNIVVCSSLGQVFKDGCEFYCAKYYWYTKLNVREAKHEFCGLFNVVAKKIEKFLLS
ncbi:serine protease inhibitor dipetalogastin-like [Coccinella septempunctata]|uniref:serine protease inhibitor dipetalogastin-like n=1 Tax=Coccinella septempunctata TaxID=41139 RepID=UPI001D05DE25|nr:serine protease inhibitor dipetalogastin-like [Coccinella septempunctata]